MLHLVPRQLLETSNLPAAWGVQLSSITVTYRSLSQSSSAEFADYCRLHPSDGARHQAYDAVLRNNPHRDSVLSSLGAQICTVASPSRWCTTGLVKKTYEEQDPLSSPLPYDRSQILDRWPQHHRSSGVPVQVPLCTLRVSPAPATLHQFSLQILEPNVRDTPQILKRCRFAGSRLHSGWTLRRSLQGRYR